VRLASRLCGWSIDIKTRSEYEAEEVAYRSRDERLERGESEEEVDQWLQTELSRIKQMRRVATGEDDLGDGGEAQPVEAQPPGSPAGTRPKGTDPGPQAETPAGGHEPAADRGGATV
jgi:hypothetical protein